MRRTILCRGWLDKVKKIRAETAEKFSTVEGLASASLPGFDEYVGRKKEEATWESFDQRVEAAFKTAWDLHKAEIWNSHKRRVREGTVAKITPAVLEGVEKELLERKEWLRGVWAQIDSDYRSGDHNRTARAMEDIEQAREGKGNEYMEWAYQTKHDMRFMGANEKERLEQQMNGTEFPAISEEEVNRFMQRRINMGEVEKSITEAFGQAGAQHWEVLQQEKDREYMKKMDDALEVYKRLQKDEANTDQAVKVRRRQGVMTRRDAAVVRMRAAVAIEEKRQNYTDSHTAMEAERRHAATEKRKETLAKAAKMREGGATSAAVTAAVKRQSLVDITRAHEGTAEQEREKVQTKKRQLFETMRAMQAAVEERDTVSAFNDAGKDVFAPKGDSQSLIDAARAMARRTAVSDDQVGLLTKRALWDLVHGPQNKGPAEVIHQARLDAEKGYSHTWKKTASWNLRNKQYKDHSKQASGFESNFYNSPWRETQLANWGLSSKTIHNLDSDPNHEYAVDKTGYHMRDKKTLDIDVAQEKRRGEGPIFRGKRHYRVPESDIGSDA